MKPLLLAVLLIPTAASATHCDNIYEYAQMVMIARNSNVSQVEATNILFSVEAPTRAEQNELKGILDWAYATPYKVNASEFALEVYQSCLEFYNEK